MTTLGWGIIGGRVTTTGWRITVDVSTGQVSAEPRAHVVHFYTHDDDLVERVAGYLADAISAGGVGVAVATADHRAAVQVRLTALGIDAAAAESAGTLVLRDAAATLDQFLADGRPDGDAFHAVIGAVISRAAQIGFPVHAFGEMVSLLWDAGQVNAAIELEALWNDLAASYEFTLFCAYRSESVAGDERADALRDVCHLHSAVVGGSPEAAVDQDWSEAIVASRTFAVGVDGPRASRQFVTETLEHWGEQRLVGDAALVVTELVTNAVIHARSESTVTLVCSPSGIRISVEDFSPVPVVRRESADVVDSGHGLGLVTAVTSSWGVDATSHGKEVWAELAR